MCQAYLKCVDPDQVKSNFYRIFYAYQIILQFRNFFSLKKILTEISAIISCCKYMIYRYMMLVFVFVRNNQKMKK